MKTTDNRALSQRELDRLIDYAYSAEPRRRAERARIAAFKQRDRSRHGGASARATEQVVQACS